jgi:protein ImuB
MHWLALLCPPSSAEATAPPALVEVALCFSPRVARREDAVVLEVEASLRLFGGARALHQRLCQQAAQTGIELQAVSWAATSLGALALARAGVSQGLRLPLAERLNALPLGVLSAVRAHQAMLARLGCRTLADVRRLPRAPLARRFGPALLQALDQAYGDAPEAHDWIATPAQFQARLELPFRVEHAPALLHHAQHLLRQLCDWLAVRHAGIRRLHLAWQHDAMRSREAGLGGGLQIATAEITRDFGHLSRLLGEHLAQTPLAAPAGELLLSADEVLPLSEHSASLLQDARHAAEQAREPLHQLLERLAARIGPEQVRAARLQEDHRLDAMQRWQPWPLPPQSPRQAATRCSPLPQPSWLYTPPLRLQTRQERPVYLGPLQKLAGPQRIESGWWDSGAVPAQQRDYYLFHSASAGLLWIYTERLSADEQGWFLHGVFG